MKKRKLMLIEANAIDISDDQINLNSRSLCMTLLASISVTQRLPRHSEGPAK